MGINRKEAGDGKHVGFVCRASLAGLIIDKIQRQCLKQEMVCKKVCMWVYVHFPEAEFLLLLES